MQFIKMKAITPLVISLTFLVAVCTGQKKVTIKPALSGVSAGKIRLSGTLTSTGSNTITVINNGAIPVSNNGSFSFTISGTKGTSAGVFKDGVLVRTLWSNVTYTNGSHTAYWDGKDDAGNLLPLGTYNIDVVSDDVQYEWSGTMANTSATLTGANRWSRNDIGQDLITVGDYGYVAKGFSEGKQAQGKFLLSAPNTLLPVGTLPGTAQSSANLCSDGTYIYWGGVEAFGNPRKSYVFATKVSDDSEVLFDSGKVVLPEHTNTAYQSVIDINIDGQDEWIRNGAEIIYGMAVNSAYLFVSRPHQNKIHVLNKITGKLLQVVTVSSPRKLYADDNSLFVCQGDGISNTLNKYTIGAEGALTSTAFSVTGTTLLNPISVTANPSGQLVVADGGLSQQIKFINKSTGAFIEAFGQAGGYSSNTRITNDKFFFRYKGRVTEKASVAFNSDGSFLVNDIGNTRFLQFDANKNYINQLISVGYNYAVQVDANDPTRVFSNYIEYKIDYSKAFVAGNTNNAWVQWRNWGYNVDAAHDNGAEPATARLKDVVTRENGRTYALLPRIDGQQKFEIIELLPIGGIRYTGIIPIANGQSQDQVIGMDHDGSIVIQYLSDDGTYSNATVKRKRPNGFDGNNNPLYLDAIGTPFSGAVEAYSTGQTQLDPFTDYLQVKSRQTSANNVRVFFDKGRGPGYHMAGVQKGTNKILFKASPSTHREYGGEFPDDGSFDIGNTVENPAANFQTYDRSIFYNYNGEFWGAYGNPHYGQTNKWIHYLDNGLHIGTFGVVPDGTVSQAGMAGNAYGTAVTKVGNDYYIYHGDESHHGGVHRWKVTGINTISEQNIAINRPTNYTTPSTPFTNLMADVPFNHSNVVIPNVSIQLTAKSGSSYTYTAVPRFSASSTQAVTNGSTLPTYVWQIDKSNDNPDLGYQTISGATSSVYTSNTFNASDKLKVTMAASSACLLTSSTFAEYQVDLNGTPTAINNTGVLSVLPCDVMMPTAFGGWTVSPAFAKGTWDIKSSYKTYKKEHGNDLFIRRGENQSTTGTVSRSLGTNVNLSNWKITGKLLYNGFPAFENSDAGIRVEVLDDAGKTISKWVYSTNYSSNFLRFNNQLYASSPFTFNYAILQPFEFSATAGTLSVKFADYAPSTAPIVDNTADWNNPATFKISFVNQSQEMVIDIADLKIFKTQ